MSDGIRVETVGLKEFQAKLRRLGEVAAEKNLVQAANAGALPIQNAAKEKAPKRTRTLSRSIHTETKAEGPYKVAAEIGPDVPYAAIQEFGGVITPKRAKMLAFEIEGRLIFAHAVHIPAHPYLRPAFDEKADEAIREVKAVLGQLLDGVTR